MTIIGLPGQELITKEKRVQDCLDFICYLSPVGLRDKNGNSKLFFSLPKPGAKRWTPKAHMLGEGGPGGQDES